MNGPSNKRQEIEQELARWEDELDDEAEYLADILDDDSIKIEHAVHLPTPTPSQRRRRLVRDFACWLKADL
jgi:hypothetical protein